ncbi:hypothetical protein, partial [Robiginitalea aurantiaca]
MIRKLLLTGFLLFSIYLFFYSKEEFSEQNTSDYILLASTEHDRKDSYNFVDALKYRGETIGDENGTLNARISQKDAQSQSVLLEPAIPIVPINKFLNGSMPVTTPDDVNGPFAPALLSQTGAFSDMINLTVSPGV